MSMSQLLPDLTIMIGLHVKSCDVMPGHAMCCDAMQWNEMQYAVVFCHSTEFGGLGLTAM